MCIELKAFKNKNFLYYHLLLRSVCQFYNFTSESLKDYLKSLDPILEGSIDIISSRWTWEYLFLKYEQAEQIEVEQVNPRRTVWAFLASHQLYYSLWLSKNSTFFLQHQILKVVGLLWHLLDCKFQHNWTAQCLLCILKYTSVLT